MAKFTSYYKIIAPRPDSIKVSDSQSLGDAGAYANYTWYQRLVQGSASRLTRYREYDIMDNDVDVSRALDTIAEEMTGNNPKTNLPLEIDIQAEDESELDSNIVLTLRAALRRWSHIHDWENRLFKVVRQTVKYGDCFFKRKDSTKMWEFVHPKNVVAALVDENNVTHIQAWQIKTDVKKPQASYGSPITTGIGQYGGETQSEIIDAKDMVRFSLNDDMSESAPFGESVLRPVYRTYKQKELLEDSIIIYRIQRAPERRVFYIDVGKMPPQRVKAYLEAIKNEIKQRKIPTFTGGTAQMETVYNPTAMSEDFYFAQRPDGRGSKVDTLPGGQSLGELSDLTYFMEKVFRGLRIPTSYMAQGTEGAIFNDGKVGMAYIQELRFALYVMRLQGYIEKILDYEFKRYIKNMNVIIDDSLYRIRLPAPTNFGTYRQQELDAQLLNSFTSADGVSYLSKRFIMERYLGLTTDEIVANERQLREEKGLEPETENKEKDYPLLYGAGAEGVGLAGGLGMGELGGPPVPPGEAVAPGAELAAPEEVPAGRTPGAPAATPAPTAPRPGGAPLV